MDCTSMGRNISLENASVYTSIFYTKDMTVVARDKNVAF